MTASQSSTDAEATFTTMSTADVEAIGAHCQASFCNQLDFLPFKCESCRGKYCLEHRTEDAHACPNKGEHARRRRAARDQLYSASSSAPKPSILTHDQQCSHPACKTLINTPLAPGIHCQTCTRDYCLKHRLAEAHACDKLPQPKPADNGIATALGRIRAWGAAKRAQAVPTSKPAPAATVTAPLKRSDTAGTLEETAPKLHRIISPFTSRKPKGGTGVTTHIMQLKRSAKGDAKIAPQARVYVHLEAVAGGEGASGAKVPRADAWFAKDWSVGKVLDGAARTLQVANVNNRGGGEEEKLRVFSVEGGRLLAFAEKLGESVKDGDTLVLLRGVGAPDRDA